MNWIAIVLVPLFALMGTCYCLRTIWVGWQEARKLQTSTDEANPRRRQGGQVLAGRLAIGLELGLAIAFIFGALFVTLQIAKTHGFSRWCVPWADNELSADNRAIRCCQGPNGARLLLTFAGTLPDCPVVFIDAANQPVGDADLTELAGRFPQTKDLLLGRTRVTDAGLSLLTRFDHLESLSLQCVPITDVGLTQLTGNRNLTFLDLTETGVSNCGMKTLCHFPRLEELRLCGTSISDVGLVHLYQHHDLRLLELTNTEVTEQGIAAAQRALPNCRIECRPR